jgi:transcription initiation factor TFIID TATA-box-binding protein
MESLNSHPSTALQAKAFTSPQSLSFPGGAGDLTPPSDLKESTTNGQTNPPPQSTALPATPAATPGIGQQQGGSGIVPVLQ